MADLDDRDLYSGLIRLHVLYRVKRMRRTRVQFRCVCSLQAVLPRAAILVHHGAIGTAAAGIRHGIPQVLIARLFTQYTNAEYLRHSDVP